MENFAWFTDSVHFVLFSDCRGCSTEYKVDHRTSIYESGRVCFQICPRQQQKHSHSRT